MVECNEFVAEVIGVIHDFYLIAVSVFIHPWQACILIRLPRISHVPHVLRLRHFAQVPDVVVEAVAVDVVYLKRGQTPVVPCPHRLMHEDYMTLATDSKIHIQITVSAISWCALSASHRLASLPINQLSAAVVVVVVLLNALYRISFEVLFCANIVHHKSSVTTQTPLG